MHLNAIGARVTQTVQVQQSCMYLLHKIKSLALHDCKLFQVDSCVLIQEQPSRKTEKLFKELISYLKKNILNFCRVHKTFTVPTLNAL